MVLGSIPTLVLLVLGLPGVHLLNVSIDVGLLICNHLRAIGALEPSLFLLRRVLAEAVVFHLSLLGSTVAAVFGWTIEGWFVRLGVLPVEVEVPVSHVWWGTQGFRIGHGISGSWLVGKIKPRAI